MPLFCWSGPLDAVSLRYNYLLFCHGICRGCVLWDIAVAFWFFWDAVSLMLMPPLDSLPVVCHYMDIFVALLNPLQRVSVVWYLCNA